MGTVAVVCYAAAGAFAVVHPDEPLFADPARSALLGRGFAAPVLAGQLPGAELRLMWQPPGYYWLLAAWFRLVDFGLIQGRFLSAIGAALAVALAFALASRRAGVAASAVAALSVGGVPWVVRAATAIRPDAWALAALLGTVLALDCWDCSRKRRTAVALLGCTTAAVLLHPLGSIAPAIAIVWLLIRQKWFAAALLSVTVAVAVAILWSIYIADLWDLFVEQMRHQTERKSGFDPLALVFSQDRLRLIGYIPLLTAGLVLLIYRRRPPLVAVLPLLIAVAAATTGGEEQYPAYVIICATPLIAIAIDTYLNDTSRGRQLRCAMVMAILVIGLTPSAVLASRGWSERMADTAKAREVADQSVFLGPRSAGVYFLVRPETVRVFSPVPIDSRAVDRTVRSQSVVLP